MSSEKSKPSTASDINTEKNRWLRLRKADDGRPEFENIMDLYWGGSERRVSTLTTRIIAVNAIALLMLLAGIVFLSQYHTNLIETKLKRFGTDIELVSSSLSEAAIENGTLDQTKAEKAAQSLSKILEQDIKIFDAQGTLISKIHANKGQTDNRLYTVKVLKNMAGFIIERLPKRRSLPYYSQTNSTHAQDYPNVEQALRGYANISAWKEPEKKTIILSGAAPLHMHGKKMGAVLLINNADDITQDVGDVWLNILTAFMLTLIVTIILSIYLSGIIAAPLRKLARAAEGVRKGQISLEDIPDFSQRNDEIGELSIAFKGMTSALSDRMDAIERFAADVAHELKNPLTSLRSATETAHKVTDAKDKEKLMAIINDDIQRLDRLITDISHLSRLDSALSRDIFERLSLQTILNNLLNIYKAPIERTNNQALGWNNEIKIKDITIKLSSNAQTSIFIQGHAGRVEQMLQNLLENALSFAPSHSEIHIKVEKNNEKVDIIFEDQGTGIPDNKIEAIFDRFYTQRPKHEAYGKHSGLGLSICRQIVTAMNGEIFAENITDANQNVIGARFTVRLNIA